MKAAVFHVPRKFRLEEVAYPRLEPDGVIIKVKDCGICGSDLHIYRQQSHDGVILGHEFSGDVVEIGEQVRGVRIGDRVVAAGGRGCGQCYWCLNNQYIGCSEFEAVGFGFPGGFAEYVFVPNFKYGLYAAKIPDTLSYEYAATAEPLSVALYAVDQMQPGPEDTVVVIGLGIIGLFIIQILRFRGVKTIIASGRRVPRLKVARESGASLVVDASEDDIVTAVRSALPKKKADIVFECAGGESAFTQSLQVVRCGGRINIIGLFENPLTWNPGIIAKNDITLVGCGLRWDLAGAIELLKNGEVNAGLLVTHRFPLEKIGEAFETQMNSQEVIKVLVEVS